MESPSLISSTIRERIAAMPSSKIREVAELGMGDPAVLPLWFGESDLPTPDYIKQAAAEALGRNETFYAPNNGIRPLREALSRYMERLYGRPVDPVRITVTASGIQAIMLTTQLLVGHGDNAVIIGPSWPNIPGTVDILGAEPRLVGLTETDGKWSLDMDRLFDHVDERTRAIIVNSPSNPTGWVMPADQQKALLDFARKRGIWIVSDEVYARIVYDGSHAPSFLELIEPEDRVVVVNSFSKAWLMTGWRLGWITAPPELLEHYGKLTEFNTSCQPPFVQHAGIAALEQGEETIKTIMAGLTENRALLTDYLGDHPRIRFAEPNAAFYAFFAIDGMGNSTDFAKTLLRETKVGLAPGAAFGAEGEGYLRLCFAKKPDMVREALDRLVTFLNR